MDPYRAAVYDMACMFTESDALQSWCDKYGLSDDAVIKGIIKQLKWQHMAQVTLDTIGESQPFSLPEMERISSILEEASWLTQGVENSQTTDGEIRLQASSHVTTVDSTTCPFNDISCHCSEIDLGIYEVQSSDTIPTENWPHETNIPVWLEDISEIDFANL